MIHGAVQKLHKQLGTLLILLLFLYSCIRGVPLLMLSSSDRTQEIEQILQLCGTTVCVMYTLELSMPLMKSQKSSYCSDEFQSKVGGSREYW